MFPTTRPRRLRRSGVLRDLVRETRLAPADFIYPLFVKHGKGVRDPIGSMPGQFHLSPDTLVEEVGAARQDGVKAVLLFGLPERKDATGSEAWDDGGAVQVATATESQARALLELETASRDLRELAGSLGALARQLTRLS